MVQIKLILAFTSIIAVSACKIDRNETVDRDKFTFHTTADTQLFFKNVRQIYYDFSALPAAHLYVYRFGDRYTGTDRPMIYPTLVMNWKNDEAYLLIETNEYLQNEPLLEIREKDKTTGKRYSYSLGERGRENMLEFATKVYEGILAENDIEIRVKDRYIPLFQTEADYEAFRIPMGDYYRLTRIF